MWQEGQGYNWYGGGHFALPPSNRQSHLTVGLLWILIDKFCNICFGNILSICHFPAHLHHCRICQKEILRSMRFWTILKIWHLLHHLGKVQNSLHFTKFARKQWSISATRWYGNIQFIAHLVPTLKILPFQFRYESPWIVQMQPGGEGIGSLRSFNLWIVAWSVFIF